jgi:hypothetical protein
MSSSGLREQHNRQLNICWREQCICLSIQMKTYVLFPPTDIQLSIMLFSQARWRHMYCSFQQIFNCHMSSSGLREQHNRQLNICWKEQYLCVHLDWRNNTIDNWISVGGNSTYVFICMYCSFQQIFNSLLCCFLNPDEDICTVPSNRYSIVYYVVNTIDNRISVGGNSTYVFIWIERTTK